MIHDRYRSEGEDATFSWRWPSSSIYVFTNRMTAHQLRKVLRHIQMYARDLDTEFNNIRAGVWVWVLLTRLYELED